MSFNSTATGEWTLASVLFMGCWLSIIISIGIFGNILVIIVSVQGTRVRTRGKSLIVSMACADMLESINMICVLTTAVMYGEWIFGDAMCKVHAFVTTEFVIASMYSLMGISLNRYFMVVKTNYYKKMFTNRNLGLMIAFFWAFPLIFAIPPLVGWSKYDFQSNKATCIFYFSSSKSFAITLMVLCIPLPLFVILYCCYQIFIEVRKHKTRVQNLGNTNSVNVEEIRITKTLIIIIMAYLICFIPPAVANLIEMAQPNYKIPFWVDVISMNLIFTNHANNPLIYGFFNRQYRQAFKEILFKVLPGNHVLSGDSSVNGSGSRTHDVRSTLQNKLTITTGASSVHNEANSTGIPNNISNSYNGT